MRRKLIEKECGVLGNIVVSGKMRNINPTVPACSLQKVDKEVRAYSFLACLSILNRADIVGPVDVGVAVGAAEIHEADGAELFDEFSERVSDNLLDEIFITFQDDSDVMDGVGWVGLEKLHIYSIVTDSGGNHFEQNSSRPIVEDGCVEANINEPLTFKQKKIAVCI